MPTMSGTVTVVANTVSANQLSGKAYEFLPYDALIEVFSTGSATGLNITVLASQDTAINDETLMHLNASAEVDMNTDIVDSFEASEGTQMRLTFRNTTGGNLVGNFIVRITPL